MTNNLSFSKKFILGFAIVMLIMLSIMLVVHFSLNSLSSDALKISNTRIPTSLMSQKMTIGINRALASLRGWMLSEKKQFKIERELAWKEEIDPSLESLKRLSVHWTNSENIRRLDNIKVKIEEFRTYQNTIVQIISENSADIKKSEELLVEKAAPAADAILKILDSMVEDQIYLFQSDFENLSNHIKSLELFVSLLFALSLLVTIILSYYLTRSVTVPISKAITIADSIGKGSLNIKIELEGSPEMSKLGRSLASMRDQIKERAQLIESKSLFQNQINTISKLTQGADNLPTVAGKVITELCRMTEAGHGTFYSIQKNDLTTKLILAGSYAFQERKKISSEIKLGDGLIGQCAKEKQYIHLTDVPADYIKIHSALGEKTPLNLIAFPIIYEDQILGAIELASFKVFNETTIEMLGQVCSNLGIVINSVLAQQKTKELLNKTQLQSEELKEKQEELKASNEELEQQAQELKASEEELKTQSEELQTINEELEEKTEALNRQKEELQRQKLEVENANDVVKEKAKDLEMASKYKSEFLANMSHELRTPLNSMLILSKALAQNKEGNLTPDQIESAKVVHSGGQDLLNLINDILDLSKVEAGKLEIRIEKVDLSLLAERMKNQFLPVAEESGVEFRTIKEVTQNFYSDEQRTEQILKNLLSNALKFTERGYVELKMSTCKERQGVLFSVKDTGVGIPQDKQKIIFEAFQQTDGSISRKYGGTGLGLSISRELSKLLGGEITLKSKEGTGSTFTLFLPNKEGNHSEEVQPQPTFLEPVKNNLFNQDFLPDDRNAINQDDRTLLIIEDDINFAKILLKHAREKGYLCIVTNSGEEGIKLTAKYMPSAILLDLGLPDLHGEKVLDNLKNNPQTKFIPVHIISAADTEMDYLKKGAIGYLKKPIKDVDIDEVLSKLEIKANGHEKNILVAELDNDSQLSLEKLISTKNVSFDRIISQKNLLEKIKTNHYDCVILNLKLLEKEILLTFEELKKELKNLPPIIVCTERELTREEYQILSQYARSIIIKGSESNKRLLDDLSMFLYNVENYLPERQKSKVQMFQSTEKILEGRKILLVDDDMRNTFALSKILNNLGIKVLIADNGADALKVMASEKAIDLVLMDIMMPIMDGYTAIKKIRTEGNYKNIPIIALTAKAMPEDKAEAIKAGANDYMTKPIDDEKLISMLKVWLYK